MPYHVHQVTSYFTPLSHAKAHLTITDNTVQYYAVSKYLIKRFTATIPLSVLSKDEGNLKIIFHFLPAREYKEKKI